MKCWYRELLPNGDKSDNHEAYVHLMPGGALSLMHILPDGRINMSSMLRLRSCVVVIDGDCMRASGFEFLNLEHGTEPSNIYKSRIVEIVFTKPEGVK